MPVEDVQLHHRHSVQRALDLFHGLEVAAHIDHQPAPPEARRVFDADCGNGRRVVLQLHQLEQGLHAVECAHDRRGPHRDQLRSHRQRVRLVLIQRLHGATRPGNVNHDAGAGKIAGHHAWNVRQRHAALKLQSRHHAHCPCFQPRIVEVGIRHMRPGLQRIAAGGRFEMRG